MTDVKKIGVLICKTEEQEKKYDLYFHLKIKALVLRNEKREVKSLPIYDFIEGELKEVKLEVK